jgi:hypothetical protein
MKPEVPSTAKWLMYVALITGLVAIGAGVLLFAVCFIEISNFRVGHP